MKKRVLTRVVQWGHDLLAEVVSSGDVAIDLTAGNGHDTLMLYQLVGETGQVVALDIQLPALLATQERLAAAGAEVRLHLDCNQTIAPAAGIDLLQKTHAELADVVTGRAMGIIANLGFLPGGTPDVITQPESTLKALEQSCYLLAVGGRLAIVVYPGHPGGVEEGATVDAFMSSLDSQLFQVVLLRVSNRPQSPFLYVVEKSKNGG